MIKKILPFVFLFLIISCGKDEVSEEIIIPSNEKLDLILSDQITVNPTGYAPLSAVISLETDRAVRISIRVVGRNGADSDVTHEFTELSSSQDIKVHGLYGNYNNQVEVSFFDNTGNNLGTQIYELETLPLILDMPQIVIEQANRAEMAEGMTLVSYFGHDGSLFPQRPFMFDSFGDIRWYLDYSNSPQLENLFYDNGMERLANGNLYFGSGGTNFGGQGDNRIYEIDLFGNIINTWDMPGYSFHHQVHEKPNGNFVVTVTKDGTGTIEDYIIEIDRQNKQIIREWDLNMSLQNSRTTLTTDAVDWVHVNAVAYDATDDTIIVSGRTQGVIKLTNTNEVVWIMGSHKEWGLAGNGSDLNNLLLQPLNANGDAILDQAVLDGDQNHPDFEWNWYQHAPLLKPNGNVMLFDNGDNRNFTGAEKYSRAVEYAVDASGMTLQQQWQYGKERGEETYSRIVSDVDYLEETDHILFSPGAISFMGSIYGRSIELDYETKEVLFEATIVPPTAFFGIITFHRTERLPLYPSQ